MKPYSPHSGEVRESYLQTAWNRFVQEHPGQRQVGNMRDGYGIYAFIAQGSKGKRYIFCAKNSRNGIDVSCHLDLVREAQRMKMEIYMSVCGTIYRFFPYDILTAKPRMNEYHGAKMANFTIVLGTNAAMIGRHRAISADNLPGLFESNHPSAKAMVKHFGDTLEKILPIPEEQ